jgi:hypothetical protein
METVTYQRRTKSRGLYGSVCACSAIGQCPEIETQGYVTTGLLALLFADLGRKRETHDSIAKGILDESTITQGADLCSITRIGW